MSGLSGFDTYEVGLGDTIVDVDGDGIITFNGARLEGSAVPRNRGSVAEVVDGQWLLGNSLALIKDRADLVVLQKSEADEFKTLRGDTLSERLAAKADRSLRVRNFPFEQQKPYGLTLGKARSAGDDYEVVNQEIDVVGGGLFPTGDVRGRFVGVSGRVEYGVGRSTINIGGVDTPYTAYYDFSLFDNKGNKLHGVSPDPDGLPVNYITTAVDYKFPEFPEGRVFLPFAFYNRGGAADSGVGIAIADKDSGRIIGSRIVASRSDSSLESIAIDQTGIVGLPAGVFCYYLVRNESKWPPNTYMFQKLDPVTLTNIGAVQLTGDPTDPATIRPAKTREGHREDWPTITLGDGTKITLSGRHNIEIQSPKLQDMALEEMAVDRTLSSGLQTLGSDTKQLISFKAESESTLVISPATSQVVAISGLAESLGSKLDLTAFNLTKEEIFARTFTVSASKYSLEDLLAGKFVAPTDLAGDEGFRRLQTRSLDDSSSSSAKAESGSFDDDYEAVEIDDIEPSFTDSAAEYSVLLLPNNQTLIFTDVAAANLTQNIAQLFTLELPSLSASASESASRTATKTSTKTSTRTSTRSQSASVARIIPEPESNSAAWTPTAAISPQPSFVPYISEPFYTPTTSPTPISSNTATASAGALAIAGGSVATGTLAGAISAGLIGATLTALGIRHVINNTEIGQRFRHRITNFFDGFRSGRAVQPGLPNPTAPAIEVVEDVVDRQEPMEVPVAIGQPNTAAQKPGARALTTVARNRGIA